MSCKTLLEGYTQPFLNTNSMARNMLNSTDNIYDDLLLLTVTQTGQGYAATFDIGLQMA